MARKPFKEEPKQGPPAYMVSFADMMTLILTFFILLVSMAKEQDLGLLAKGLGSFVVAIESHGLNGILDGTEREMVFEHMRRRFNLPPEEDPERREEHMDAADLELLRAEALEGLKPHKAITQPMIAVFEPGSHELTAGAKKYIDRIAGTLKPSFGQLLLLEGHADPSVDPVSGDLRYLAFQRAVAVRDYLIEQHGIQAPRIETRAWLVEVPGFERSARSVDARLITPNRATR